MSKQMDPLNGNGTFSYDNKSFTIEDSSKVLAANQFFSRDAIKWYTKFNRFGYLDPFDKENVIREYLFFTKPDLNIFSNSNSELTTNLSQIPYFMDGRNRHTYALWQLQQTYCPSAIKSPFMVLLSNAVTSKLDLPDISAESQNTTSNIMGVELTLRGHSYKSDNGYDFTLSINDTAYLEVYSLVKAYDEYVRRTKTGEHSPFKKYIEANIVSDQFSVYKFLVGDDGETILYFAKLTGVYFTGVPRSDFSDPTDFGKFSLSFHAQFVEDNNPLDIKEFNRLVESYAGSNYTLADTWNAKINAVNNEWVKLPIVKIAQDARSKRRSPEGSRNYYDYRLRWIK